MRSTLRLTITTTALLFVFMLSAVITIPVYADDGTPPADVPVEVQPTEPPTQASAVEEAAPQTPPEPAAVIEETPVADTVDSILTDVPQGTDVVVLGEEGDVIPLATKEAAQAVSSSDPIWCPAGVTPVSDANGCSTAFNTFSDLLLWLPSAPSKTGTIWIHKDYVSSTATSNVSGVDDVGLTDFTLNGSSLGNIVNFALTIQGGWTGTGKNILIGDSSEFIGASLNILNWNNAVTLNDISIYNQNTGIDSLKVTTTGSITLNRVSVHDNSQGGANLANNVPSGIGDVTVNDSQFNNNASGLPGLDIHSFGAVTLTNLVASGNGAGGVGIGIQVDNHLASPAKPVTLTNITTSDNFNLGLSVTSKGMITATDLTVINNGRGIPSGGASLSNTYGVAGVVLKGTNLFFDNKGTGLVVNSLGAISLNNIQAVNNTSNGANIINNSASTPQAVMLTGSSSFKFNSSVGLSITSLGQITVNNITANSNGSTGANLNNFYLNAPDTSGVKLTGSNIFDDNVSKGLIVTSKGTVLLNNITANDNNHNGAYIDNTSSSTFKGVTLTGTNNFSGNTQTGLVVMSDGVISLSNITADGNSDYGVNIDNTTSTTTAPKAVTLSGANHINENHSYGLFVVSYGAISVNNLTASFNGILNSNGNGAYLDNYNLDPSHTPAAVTLTGTNVLSGNYSTGLYVLSLGIIKVNNLTASDSVSQNGANLANNFGTSTNGVIMTGTNLLTGNKLTNIIISTNGSVNLSNMTANDSLNGGGLGIDNCNFSPSACTTPLKPVTLSGTNSFTGNASAGLSITSSGVITISNVTANDNTGYGALLQNAQVNVPVGITLTGSNSFNGNSNTGLYIQTLGNFVSNNLTANTNTGAGAYGVYIDLYEAGSIGNVTMNGVNSFTGNKYYNLYIYAAGAITINNLTASLSQTGMGASISNNLDTTKLMPVTLTGANTFNGNYSVGLAVYSYGLITTNNLTATGNGLGDNEKGVYLYNASGNPATPMGVTMNGVNILTGNKSLNLFVESLGAILASNVTASGGISHYGAAFNNYTSTKFAPVTLTGVNNFNNNPNGDGVAIGSAGIVTLNNVTANGNNSDGISVDNSYGGFASPKAINFVGFVTANGNNSTGITVDTYGAVNMINVTANNNASNGLSVGQALVNSTPANLIINGTNSFSGNTSTGLDISTLGTVTLNNVTASDNGTYGASIYAMFSNAIGTVIMNGTNTFTGNTDFGLSINTSGAVTLNNINASTNGNAGGGGGLDIDNTGLGTSAPQTVKLTGTNTFNDNFREGLKINTYGAVSLNNITANNNTFDGVWVKNHLASLLTPASVTLTGTNQFNNNTGGMGLYVQSIGSIAASNVTASGNSNSGVYFDNVNAATPASVTLSGVNVLVENGGDGLDIQTSGTVNLTKITADGNNNYGMYIVAGTANINMTCGSLIGNTGRGYNLSTNGVMTLKGVISAGNGTADSAPTGTLVKIYGCPLP